MNVDDRAVRGVDDRQGRGVRLDIQQRRADRVGLVADRLGQCGRGQERRDQHHILDLVGGQRVPKCGAFDGVSKGDAGRCQLVAALGRAFPGPQDRRDYLARRSDRCRVIVVGHLEIVFFDGGAVAIFTFDQHHTDCRRRHRHSKYGVQSSSIVVC